jgi:hypothetical protein
VRGVPRLRAFSRLLATGEQIDSTCDIACLGGAAAAADP